MTTVTITDLVNEFGSFYKDGGQGAKDILSRPFFPFGTREAMTNIPTNDTIIQMSDTEIGKVLQPWQKAYTPQSALTFKPVTINLRPVKVDHTLSPDDLKNLAYSWLGFLSSPNIDRSQWPFIRWFIEEYSLNQTFEDLEMDAIYKGVYAAPVAGTPGLPGEAIDGVRKLINDNIANMSLINTGALSNDPVEFVTQLEEFVKSVGKRFWRSTMTINVNPDREVLFTEGMQKKYNINYAQVSDLKSIRNFSNITVAGRMSMDGSDKIWMTPKANIVFATKGFSNAEGYKVETEKRNVHIFTDFHIGLGFLQPDLVFTNDQDM